MKWVFRMTLAVFLAALIVKAYNTVMEKPSQYHTCKIIETKESRCI